jgi:tetratricopeptide (TPR) repeat protein
MKHFREAIRYAEESQTVVYLGMAWACLGWAHCLMEQFRTGLDLAEKGLKMHQDLGLPYFLSLIHYSCGSAHFELGELEEARTHLKLGLQSALQSHERAIQAAFKLNLGWVMVRKDPTQIEAAVEYINQGINQLEEQGIRTGYSLGYMILGAVNAESDRPEKALEHLKKAEIMFEEMGMDYHLRRTREILGKL